MDKKISQRKKTSKQKPQRNKSFPFKEKENLTEIKNLPSPSEPNQKYPIHNIFNLQDLFANISLKKLNSE